jgi:hypothetical protein
MSSMISLTISLISTAILAVGGVLLLFASDVLLPLLVPGLSASAGWLGQPIAAAWLTVALYNWNARQTILGGIYGRPSVNLNLVLYTVTALGMLKAEGVTLAIRVLTVPFGIMAIVYVVVLLRGPFDRSRPSPAVPQSR